MQRRAYPKVHNIAWQFILHLLGLQRRWWLAMRAWFLGCMKFQYAHVGRWAFLLFILRKGRKQIFSSVELVTVDNDLSESMRPRYLPNRSKSLIIPSDLC